MAIDFEAGSSQWLDMGLSLPALNGKGGCTLMCWVKIESEPEAGHSPIEIAIGPPPGTSNNSRARLSLESGNLPDIGGRALDTDSFVGLTSTTALSIGVLAHIVGTINLPDDECQIFQDGVRTDVGVVAFSQGTFSATNSKNAAIGASDTGDQDFMDGILEDVRVYDRVLSAAEILTIFNARGVDGIVQGLQHRYLLNEDSAGVAASGAGSIKDIAFRKLNIDPNASPVYASGALRFRRKLA